MTTRHRPSRRQMLAGSAATVALTGFPAVLKAQERSIRVGVPAVFSGRMAHQGSSARNGLEMEVAAFNEAGGLDGRLIELVVRDSKGQPDEGARVVRDMVNSERCDVILNCEFSAASFAIHEVARESDFLCIHAITEASVQTADPKLRIPNAFRVCRQGIHDSIAGALYAAEIAKQNGLTRWVTCSPDYAYGRDTTQEFVEYLQQFVPDVEIVAQIWPKFGAADYTAEVAQILQAGPQALYSCLWGGDLVSFIDQANLYALFDQMETFAVNLADYTTLTAVTNLPEGVHSGNRYVKSFPPTDENRAWGEAYHEQFGELPTTWSWQAASAAKFLITAMRETNSLDNERLADALRGMTVDSPFGAAGSLTLREFDQTLVDYATGWGRTVAGEPYLVDTVGADWNVIREIEAEWMEQRGFI